MFSVLIGSWHGILRTGVRTILERCCVQCVYKGLCRHQRGCYYKGISLGQKMCTHKSVVSVMLCHATFMSVVCVVI